MFRNFKEYQELQKLYEEKVSRPKQLDELKAGPGPNTPPKKTTSFGDAIKANQNRSATTTSTPKMSTSGAQITTNQRQSRELASKNKDVKLNKFSRTKTYGADAKGVKLVPGAKVGQQVNRSTVQTKAEFDFGGIKKGERLGVMTRNQRRKYDLMAAQRAKKTEPKPDIKPIDKNPFQGEPKTDEKKPVENKGRILRGQGGRPLGSTTRRQGGSVKDGKKLFIDKDKAKAYTDKTGNASQVVSKDELVKRTSRAPVFQSFGKSRQLQSQGKNPQTVISRDTKKQLADAEEKEKQKRQMGRSAAKRRQQENANSMKEAYASMYNQNEENKMPNAEVKASKLPINKDKNFKTGYTSTSADGIPIQNFGNPKDTTGYYSDSLGRMTKFKNRPIHKNPFEKKDKTKKEEFTPYDIVLEYLLSTEQVATIEEANYVMTEMDAETIQGIVSEGLGSAIKEVGKTVGNAVKKGVKKLKGGEMKGDFPSKGGGPYTA